MPGPPQTKAMQNHRTLMSLDLRLPSFKRKYSNCDDIPMNIDYLKYYPDKLLQSNRNPKNCYRGFMKPYKIGFSCPPPEQNKICYRVRKFDHSALPLNMYGRNKRSVNIKYYNSLL